jgi:SAM-dependent methyltransferase
MCADFVSTASVVPPPDDSVRSFARWVAHSVSPGAPVLNVGAGKDISGALQPLLRREPYLVGVDPDAAIESNTSLAERHRTTLEEFAAGNAGRFDVVLSVYVIEHVTDPAAFAAANAKVLRPGGEWFGLTLNVQHYFGATTRAMSRVGLSDWLLHRLAGDDLQHEHHFPPAYRLNSLHTLRRTCADAGFDRLEVRCYDATDRYQWYLPRGLGWFAPAYTRLAYAVGRPGLMGHLSFRAILPS